MLFKNLSPLINTSSDIAYARLDDLKPLFPANPFRRSEKETIEEYNSSESSPQLAFLGLDESQQDGLRYDHHNGVPHFALDITPKASYEQEARKINTLLESRGLVFLEGTRTMNFPPDRGTLTSIALGVLGK
jgi:NAD+ diphosphatase